jgi:hypothetical protein
VTQRHGQTEVAAQSVANISTSTSTNLKIHRQYLHGLTKLCSRLTHPKTMVRVARNGCADVGQVRANEVSFISTHTCPATIIRVRITVGIAFALTTITITATATATATMLPSVFGMCCC